MTVAGRTTAIVLAGGSGTRMGAELNKVYLRVGGRSVLGRSLATFASSPEVDRVVLVRRAVDADIVTEVLTEEGLLGNVTVVDGGATRYQSERCGLAAVAPDAELVAIHDGARPFLTHALLGALLGAARRRGGALPALELDGDIGLLAGDAVVAVDASRLRRVQTPQVFGARGLLDAYAAAPGDADGFDTAEIVERYGRLEVEVVPGDPRNLKLTTPADVDAAERLAARWRDGRWLEG